MKRVLLVVLLLLLIVVTSVAKLSDDTLEEVEKLRWKHYGYKKLGCADCVLVWAGSDIEWTRIFLSISVEGDKLIIETQDGKWYIEMKEMIDE